MQKIDNTNQDAPNKALQMDGPLAALVLRR